MKMPPRMRSLVFFAPRRFSPKYIASSSATPMRANSDGCRWNGPIGIQRWPAHLRLPLDQHEDEQHEQAAVDEQRVLGEHAVVDRQADEQRDQPEAERVDLGPDLRSPHGRRSAVVM